MTNYRESLNGSAPSEESLSEHLALVFQENRNTEFKSCTLDGDYQLRKPVASLANHEGGELFIGVEDGTRAIKGTALNRDSLFAALKQEGPLDDWYSLDLTRAVDAPITVPIADPTKRVLVVEVRKGLLPVLVIEQGGERVWYERIGDTNHKLTGVEGAEARRRYERGRLLLELYREFDFAARMILQSPFRGVPVAAAYFTLPRYEAAKADGSFYSILTERDREVLMAHPNPGDGPRVPAILPGFIAEGIRLDRRIEQFNRLLEDNPKWNWEAGPANEIREARLSALRGAEQFSSYLKEVGLLASP
jgi:Putative DNA-binding domain